MIKSSPSRAFPLACRLLRGRTGRPPALSQRCPVSHRGHQSIRRNRRKPCFTFDLAQCCHLSNLSRHNKNRPLPETGRAWAGAVTSDPASGIGPDTSGACPRPAHGPDQDCVLTAQRRGAYCSRLVRSADSGRMFASAADTTGSHTHPVFSEALPRDLLLVVNGQVCGRLPACQQSRIEWPSLSGCQFGFSISGHQAWQHEHARVSFRWRQGRALSSSVRAVDPGRENTLPAATGARCARCRGLPRYTTRTWVPSRDAWTGA